MSLILFISGKANSGKDTIAKMIKKQLFQEDKNVLIIHYADYLKFICKEYFGWNGEKDDIGRTILQRIGTDEGRNVNPDVWVNVVREFIKTFGREYDVIIIPDTRFKNEINIMNSPDFEEMSVRVVRKGLISPLSKEQQNHLSEIDLDYYNFDAYIPVDEGLDKVQEAVDKFLISR